MTADRLLPQREAEIRERIAKRTAEFTEWINRNSPFDGQDKAQHAEAVLEEDVPELLAELAAVRAERDEARAQAFREAAAFLSGHGYHLPADLVLRLAKSAAGAASCKCGEPSSPDTVHRADGPCYVDEGAAR